MSAYSYVLLPGDGSNTTFSFPFPYLDKAHIVVKAGGIEVPFIWLGENIIRVTPAPKGNVEIRRKTPKDTAPVNFSDGSVLKESELDLLATFSLFSAQEIQDIANDALDQSALGSALYHVYQGSLAVAPLTRTDGTPLQAGDMYFSTALKTLRVFSGVAWQDAGTTVAGVLNKPTTPVIATAGQTVVPVPGNYDPLFIAVFVNGIAVSSPAVNTTSGTNLVFSPALAAGDKVTWLAFGAFQLTSTYTKADLALPTAAANIGFTDGLGAAGTLAGLATKQAMRNDKTTATTLGEVPGMKIGVCAPTEAGWTSNPAVNDFVAVYPFITSSAVRTRVWAINPIVDVKTGFPATAYAIEANINNGLTTNAPDPHSVGHQLGIEVASGGTMAPSAVLSSLGTTAANRFKHGIWLESIGGQPGSTFIKAAGPADHRLVDVDFGVDLSMAKINYQGLRIGLTPAAQVAAAGIRQMADGQVGLFLQRFTDSAPTGNVLQFVNATNTTVLTAIDALGNVVGTSFDTANTMRASQFISIGPAQPGAAGTVMFGNSTTTTVGASGASAATPVAPAKYLTVYVGNTPYKLPLYNS